MWNSQRSSVQTLLAGVAQPRLSLSGRAGFDEALRHCFYFAARGQRGSTPRCFFRPVALACPQQAQTLCDAHHGRIRNQRTMSSVTPTSRARRRNAPEAALPHGVAFAANERAPQPGRGRVHLAIASEGIASSSHCQFVGDRRR